MTEREPLLVSACLLGVNCRYDGGCNYCAAALLKRNGVQVFTELQLGELEEK